MRCEEDHDLILPDGQVHIYLNTHGTNDNEVPGELVELLHYMEHTTQKNRKMKSERVQKLSRQVEKIKADQEVGIKYMRFRDEFLLDRLDIKEEVREEVKEEVREEVKEEVREEVKEEVREEVKEEVKKLQSILLICKKLAKQKSVEEIADAIESDVSFVRVICDIAKNFAPDYDAEKIWSPPLPNTKSR